MKEIAALLKWLRFVIAAILAVWALYWFTGGAYGTATIFGPPDKLSPSRREEIYMTPMLYYANGGNFQIGDVKGVTACRAAVKKTSEQKNLGPGWAYACCTHEANSKCYRKLQ